MQKVLIIVGPTGVGKSSLSIQIAKKFHGEIISGDAYQVYHQMNIGSAKIQADEMQGIPHYLVDFLDVKNSYNVKLFQKLAREAITEIDGKGLLPIICGGTGLYIKSALYDYEFHEEEIDEIYLKELAKLDDETLYQMLIEVDANSTKTIHKNNRKRVIRALMMEHLGHRKSEVIANQNHETLYDIKVIGLTCERELLYQRINERVDTMIKQGLQKEIESMYEGEQTWQLQSMQGIGYKEWKGFFEEHQPLEEIIELIKKNTRNFAKRQYTWFKNQMDVTWFDIYDENYLDNMNIYITSWLNDAN